MASIDTLKKIEGKQTVDTVSAVLEISKQSAINLLSSLKKEGHVVVSGGGKQKRIYTISVRKILPRKEGMFEVLNKYSKEKIVPHFVHEPRYTYNVENAIIDLVQLNDIRVLTNVLSLFNHVTDWSLLYQLAKKKNLRKKVGALYDVARSSIKVRKMPERTKNLMIASNDSDNFSYSSGDFKDIEHLWKVKIPFKKEDLLK